MPFRTVVGDIFEIEADAIVIPANIEPKDCGGLDTAAYKKAGYDKMLAARQKIGVIDPGWCKETPAFDLKAKYALHTVTPAYMTEHWSHLLDSSYSEAIICAWDLDLESIVFPLLGAGNMGIPVNIAMDTALYQLNSHADALSLDLTLVITPEQQYLYENSYMEYDEELLDEMYVVGKVERVKYYENVCSLYQKKMSDKKEFEAFLKKQRKFLKNNPHLTAEVYRRDIFVGYITENIGKGKLYSSQQEFAVQSDIDVANLNRIINGDRRITKDTAIKAALALELPIDDFKRCIFCSGSSFPCDEADLIIEKCVKEKLYDYEEIQNRIDLNASKQRDQDR